MECRGRIVRSMRFALMLALVAGALGLCGGCDAGSGTPDETESALETPPGPPDQTNTKVKRR